MNIEWSNIIMGPVSLFPLAGTISKLKGFFPRNMGPWFVTFSTIFSSIVYIYVQWFFKELENILPVFSVWLSAVIAIISFFIYISIHLTVKPLYPSLSLHKKVIYIMAAMIFYFVLIISLTYSFNVLENYKDYQIISGIIKLEGEKINNKARISFNIEGINEPYETKGNGNFFIIMEKDKFRRINTVTFEAFGRPPKKLLIEDLERNSPWKINID